MKRTALCLTAVLWMLGCVFTVGAKTASSFTSPNGKISVALLSGADTLGWTVSVDGKLVYTERNVSMTVGKRTLGVPGKPKSVSVRRVAGTLRPTVPMKQSVIDNNFTEAALNFGGYSVQIRVMDNAVAYRFVTRMKGSVEVGGESFAIVPAAAITAHIQPSPATFNTSFEEPYRHQPLAEWAQAGTIATIPALLSAESDRQLLIGESDVDDYPKLFLRSNGNGVTPTFPKSPLAWQPKGDRSETITQEAAYIAKTDGTRTFPWRYVVVTDSKGILEQTITAQLARPCKLSDTSWIEPGQVSWEWWNGAAPFGPDVHFKSGCNYDTYCYYADFAAKYGIKYILLDEGWAASTTDPFHGNPDLRLQDLIKYCDGKGVKIILWLPWLAVEKNLDTIFKTYAQWGIHAVKIDFMDHGDQWMVNFYKRVVEEAARNKVMIDWHGAFTPAGLELEYPNVLSYEGVRGLEQMGGCPPANTIYIPFIRNAVGPADFTPGGMINMQPEVYYSRRPNSAAMGTRCFQMALYVVLESGLQMLADSPTQYYNNDECARFIASVPVTWDETRALAAEVGKYAVVAKRKGQKWFVGGICSGDGTSLSLPLDFLKAGKYKLTIFTDGSNAGYQAMHYYKDVREVEAGSTLDVKMEKNGGFAASLELAD